MKRDLLFDCSSVLARTSLAYVFSVFLCLGRPLDTPAIFLTLGIILLTAFVFYLFRRRVNNALLFAALHIFMAVLAFFLLPTDFRFGFAAGLVFLTADSMYCRLRRSGTGEYAIHWAPAAFLCVLYIVAAAYNMQQFTTVCFYGEACFLSFYFLQAGLFRTGAFLDDNDKQLANVPVLKIRTQTGKILLVFAVVVFAVMFVAPKTFFMSGLMAIVNGLLFVLNKALGLIDVGKPGEIQETEQIELGSVFNGGIFEKSGKISPIWDILDNIVFILVYAVIMIGAIALLVFVYGRLKHLFNRQQDSSNDVMERIVPDKVQRVWFRNEQKTEKISGPNENVKIRKLYKKYVQAAIKEAAVHALTPGEISKMAGDGGEIQHIYEKARYSGSVCEKADTEQMKNNIKAHKRK